ncbi:MAG: LIM domain protein [bacterium ADurb.Bin363]|mgnify:CR=1 FL=1|nr:MAG: LIM domain protein [bacterium ADurb.Bin363]
MFTSTELFIFMKKIFLTVLFLSLCFNYAIASIVCNRCGSVITDTYWTFKGNIYCNNCYPQVVPKCDICGQSLYGQYRIVKDKNYCENCYQASVPRCRLCNEILEGEYLTSLDGKSVYCKRCYEIYPSCCNCSVPIGLTGMTLIDGRRICSECYSIAIFELKPLEDILEEVKIETKKLLGSDVMFPLQIKLIDKMKLDELKKKKNIEYVPLDGVTALHYYTKLNNTITVSEIYILSGLIPVRAIGTLAHEYTHAWQAENCPDNQDISIREGFAEWISYKVLKVKGYNRMAENMLKTSDPVYGEGLKKMLQIEKEEGLKGVLKYARKEKFTVDKSTVSIVEATPSPQKNKHNHSNLAVSKVFILLGLAGFLLVFILVIYRRSI